MRYFRTIACLIALGLAAHADDDQQTFDRIVLRVTGNGPDGSVVVDRGKRDGLERGDRVEFFPREGGVYRGTVKLVDGRTALVTLNDKKFKPAPGTRGEVLVPASRFGGPAPAPEPKPKPEPDEPKAPETTPDQPEKPRWKNRDEGWSPDMPLLSGMRPVRPIEREKKFTAVAWVIADVVQDFEGDYDNSIVRVGGDATLTNFFGHGGEVNFSGEIASLTEADGEEGLDLLVRRLSYIWGGHRFSPMRIEAGRFLHSGITEFGFIDGGEWSKRRENGHVYGFSAGFLPEPEDDFESFSDFSLAGFYRWVNGPDETLTLTGGYQKTWHNGTPDRDLIVAKARFLPSASWDLHATVLIDFYTGSDVAKSSNVELTEAYLYAGRRFENGSGWNLTYRHLVFPALLRNEFTPILQAELDDNRTDRVSANAWWWMQEDKRVHGYVAGWNDEDHTGGAAEIGLDWHDLLQRRSVVTIVAFINVNEFEDLGGLRVAYGRWFPNGRWDVLYEISQHRFDGFPGDRNDLVQHRARGSMTYVLDVNWDFSGYIEIQVWDEEVTWAVGITAQRKF